MGVFGQVLDQLLNHPRLLLVGFLLYVFIYALSWFFSAPKPGPNPFKTLVKKPLKPLVTNQKLRDKVLKQGFQAKQVPQDLDAIVVGSGIGGLTVAGILSKAGKKVLVLEQHDQAGGCCHTFVEQGFEFDVGVHYIGEMRSNTVARILIDQLTDGQLQWVDLIDEFDLLSLGEPGKRKSIPFRTGSANALRTGLLEKFPKEEAAIDKFMAMLKDVRLNMKGMLMVKVMPKWIVRLLIATGLINLMTRYFKYARRTVQEVLDELTDDGDLKAILSYSFGDYGVEPSRSSFGLHAALVNHYLYGASYPKGGASEIAFHMIPVIERNGGRVFVRAPVSQIITDPYGKAIGVRVDRASGPMEITAPLVISDTGAMNTFAKLLPQEIAKKSSITRLLGNKLESGTACMSLFVGLIGTAEELGLKPQHIWSYPSNDLSGITTDYLEKSVDEAVNSDLPMIFITFPSAKDPTFNERYPGKSVCTAVSLCNWKWFSEWEKERVKKRGEDYEAVKMAIGRKMWDHVLTYYPQLEDKVEYFEVATPLSNKYYIASPKGEIYGLDHTAKRFGSPETVMHLRAETGIPGLLLTGQDVVCCGFVGAMMGGLLCASTALHRNVYEDLVKLRKETAKTK